MNNNYMPESEWDTAMFHGLRLHDIRQEVNRAYLDADYKRLHNLLNVWKNELVMVMHDDDLSNYQELLNKALKHYTKGGVPSSLYDDVIQELTLIQNKGGLGIKRKISLKGATGRR